MCGSKGFRVFKFCNVVRVATVTVWLVLAGDLLVPEDLFSLGGQWGRMMVGLAIVGSMTIIFERHQRPIEEVFDAGREYQRRVGMREQNCRASISPIRRVGRKPDGLARTLTNSRL